MPKPVWMTVLGLGLLAGCGKPQVGHTHASHSHASHVVDLDGRPQAPLASATSRVQVFVVTSHECPIANAYAPVLGELAAAWREEPVDLYVVQADPDLSAAEAATHRTDYQLPGLVLLDPHHELIAALGATKTPEAIVRKGGAIVYRGRIDDQWHALGSRAQQASCHDLRDAVAAVLAGKPVAMATTAVIGCWLPEPRR